MTARPSAQCSALCRLDGHDKKKGYGRKSMDDFKLLDAQRLFEREPDGLVGLRVDHLGHVHVADDLFCAELEGDREEGVRSARSNNTLQGAGSVAIIDKVELPEEAAIAGVERPVTVNVVDLGRRVDACKGTHTPLTRVQPTHA